VSDQEEKNGIIYCPKCLAISKPQGEAQMFEFQKDKDQPDLYNVSLYKCLDCDEEFSIKVVTDESLVIG
jgi:hypothetical protein